MSRVVVVGSINVDYVVAVDTLPRPGETVTGGRFTRHLGGKGANQAVAAGRYGVPVRLVGAVGADQAGLDSLADLRGEGVDVSAVETLPDVPTGAAVITVDREGANQIAVASGANHALRPRLEGIFESTDPGVLCAVFELPNAVVVSAARAAAAAGWTVVVNPAPARALHAALLETGPLLTPNRVEARELTGLADPAEAARQLERLTGAPAIVTLGDEGALVCDGHRVEIIPAATVDAVDSTGAGDTFSGILVAALLEGRPLLEAARIAVLAAGRSTERPGARGGMPTASELSVPPGAAHVAPARVDRPGWP